MARQRKSYQLSISCHRQWRIIVTTVAVVFVIVGLRFLKTRYALKPDTDWDSPPSWDVLRQRELNLPQHNLDLPFPEGKNGRYVKFSNQIRRSGWNNVFTELYVCSPLQAPIALTSLVS